MKKIITSFIVIFTLGFLLSQMSCKNQTQSKDKVENSVINSETVDEYIVAIHTFLLKWEDVSLERKYTPEQKEELQKEWKTLEEKYKDIDYVNITDEQNSSIERTALRLSMILE